MNYNFIQNKYYYWYNNIVNKAKSRTLDSDIYTEKHHIIPKSLGGDNSELNLVKLTAREHFICHRILVKITKNKNKRKMAYAVRRMMTGKSKNHDRIYITSSKIYEMVRKENNKHLAGYKHSPEVRAKMSKSLKGRKFSKETIIKMSKSRTGKPQPKHVAERLRVARLGKITSQEVKDKISQSLTGRIVTTEHKRNMSKNHADVSGINNPRSKIWEVISPAGEKFTILGDMDTFCKNHNLPASTMRAAGRNNVSPKYGKCKGWKIKIVNSEQVEPLQPQD